jgi:hypothetical protein
MESELDVCHVTMIAGPLYSCVSNLPPCPSPYVLTGEQDTFESTLLKTYLIEGAANELSFCN